MRYEKVQIEHFSAAKLDEYSENLERAMCTLNDGSVSFEDVRVDFALEQSTCSAHTWLVPRWGWAIQYENKVWNLYY